MIDRGMDCTAVQAEFSGYLDGAVSGRVMQRVALHLEQCRDCRDEFAALRASQHLLGAIGPARVPADLALRIRVAVSQEHTRQAAWSRARLAVRWTNTFAPLLLQAAAGLASAVLLFSFVLLGVGLFASPTPVLAKDEPLQFHTAPHLRYVAASADADTANLHDVVVQAWINARGQVYDFRIVSGPDTPETRALVARRLLLSVFEPARIFGQPVSGHAILSYSGVKVTA